MLTSPVKVIIADDHTLFAEGLEQLLLNMPHIQVVAKVFDGKSLLQKLNNTNADLILLDVNMPNTDGLTAASSILQSYPKMKILFISMYYNEKIIQQAIELGAYGYMMKDITAPELKAAINSVINGDKTFAKPENLQQNSNYQNNNDNFLVLYKITDREFEIIHLILQGLVTKQIAAKLELSIYTIETHKKNIHRKLKVQSTAELIATFHTIKNNNP